MPLFLLTYLQFFAAFLSPYNTTLTDVTLILSLSRTLSVCSLTLRTLSLIIYIRTNHSCGFLRFPPAQVPLICASLWRATLFCCTSSLYILLSSLCAALVAIVLCLYRQVATSLMFLLSPFLFSLSSLSLLLHTNTLSPFLSLSLLCCTAPHLIYAFRSCISLESTRTRLLSLRWINTRYLRACYLFAHSTLWFHHFPLYLSYGYRTSLLHLVIVFDITEHTISASFLSLRVSANSYALSLHAAPLSACLYVCWYSSRLRTGRISRWRAISYVCSRLRYIFARTCFALRALHRAAHSRVTPLCCLDLSLIYHISLVYTLSSLAHAFLRVGVLLYISSPLPLPDAPLFSRDSISLHSL